MTMTTTTKHPDGVYTVFFLQMFSMVGFSMLFSLLTLYATHVLHFTDQRAYDISTAFNAQVFAVSVLGGFLASKFLGYRYAFILSAVLAIGGLALILSTNTIAFYSGLGMYVLAMGIQVPALNVLLSMLYDKGDARRDSGFILAYVGMNVGSFFATLFSGPISEKYGYHSAFFVGLVFAVITLINYLLHQYKFKPAKIDQLTREHAAAISRPKKIGGTIITLIFIPIIAALMDFPQWNNTILISLGIIATIVTLYFANRYEAAVRHKIWVFLILCYVALFFWALYLLVPTVLPLFTERNVDRHFFSWVIPTASFSSLNPFFIITIGPLLSLLWLRLQKKNIVMTTPGKFVVALILMGAGFAALSLGIHFHNPLGLILAVWMVLSYFLQTVGELFIGPIGYAMVGSLVPFELEGFMQGVWQLFTGISGVFTAFLASLTHRTVAENVTNPLLTNHDFSYTFLLCGSVTMGAGIVLALFVPRLKRIISPIR
jgi:POT family proton-dependent oligopeptide transporter